jgi:hypothetical protein
MTDDAKQEREVTWNGSFGAVSVDAEITRLRDALKIARDAAIEECASKVEDYPSPLDDLPMAMAMRNVAAAIRRLKEQIK